MKIICNNKKANFEYFIVDKYVAGLVLFGSEVKSIREGGISLDQSFIFIEKGEIFLKNCYIKPYDKTTCYAPDIRRDRKLLLNKSEIAKLFEKVKTKGLTLVPLKVFISDKNLVKIEIALAQGKHLYDKRKSIKERDVNREINRAMSKINR